MRHPIALAALLLTACAAAHAVPSEGGAPMCVSDLVATMEDAEPGNPAYSVWQCTYRGSTVYYLPPQCCDQYSALLAADCTTICAPDGGFTGGGDGRCPDFDPSSCAVLWRDPRGPS